MQYKRQRSKDCKSEHLQILLFLAWRENRERERERESKKKIVRLEDHS